MEVTRIERPRKAGRPHLDGSPPGEGEKVRGVTVSLTAADAEALKEIGAGIRSEGVRRLLEMWRREQEVEQQARQSAGATRRGAKRPTPQHPRPDGRLKSAAV